MIRTSKRGQRLRDITFIEDPETGRMFPLIAGGAGDEVDDDDREGGDEDDLEDEDVDDEEDDDREPSGNKGDTISRDEYEALKRRMKGADRRATAAEQALREKEDEEKSELERTQRDLEEASTARDDLQKENAELRLRLAVLTAPDAGKFHDPEDLLLRLTLDDLTDDDGELDKSLLTKELKRLAKDKPHLVRASDGDDEDEEEDEKPPKSGRHAGNGKKDKKGLDRARLERKYSALRR